MVRLTLTSRARRELREIGDWIARDNPRRAETFVNEIEAACAKLIDAPHGYPVLTRVGELEVRKKVFAPYLILYQVRGMSVRILAIVHGARDLKTLRL